MADHVYNYFSNVRESKVEWLWYSYIPYEKLTVLQEDPDEGKSSFILNVAARLTKGLDMSDGYKTAGPHTVIYQCAEDDVSDTIKPRLVAAGANYEKVAYIVDTDEGLSLDDARIEDMIPSGKQMPDLSFWIRYSHSSYRMGICRVPRG